jgi:hypothetical protein
MMTAKLLMHTNMPESINPFEKIVPVEQPREQEIPPLQPEKKPHNPAMVNELIRGINEAEQEEKAHRERVDEIRRNQTDKPTLQ